MFCNANKSQQSKTPVCASIFLSEAKCYSCTIQSIYQLQSFLEFSSNVCQKHLQMMVKNSKQDASLSPFSLPWQKVIWQNFAIGLGQFEKPKPRPQVIRSPILSENCDFYIYFLVKSWDINVKLMKRLPKLIKSSYFFKKR